jgi:hypothetical protein
MIKAVRQPLENVVDISHRSPAGGVIAPCEGDDSCEVLSCAVCLEEVPADAVKSADAQDYVHHFCGLACFDVWLKQGRTAK